MRTLWLAVNTETVMSTSPEHNSQSELQRLEAAADSAIATCDGNLRATIISLILANEFLEHELETQVSLGYVRGVRHGRFKCYSG